MEKLKMHSPNLTDENIAKIAELFLGCVTEVKEPQIRKRIYQCSSVVKKVVSVHKHLIFA